MGDVSSNYNNWPAAKDYKAPQPARCDEADRQKGNFLWSNNNGNAIKLRPVTEVPPPYQEIFAEFPYFNVIQSEAFAEVFYSDDAIVVSAPTGSGKTLLFELAIVRHLMTFENTPYRKIYKIVYLAPVKALCQERLVDWHRKFSKFDLNCISVTGDSDNIDFQSLLNHNLIISTPEKWDSLTRKWKDNQKLVQVVKLFLLDEIHLLHEESRGPTLEAVVSRMKTVQDTMALQMEKNTGSREAAHKMRFLALSATIPNVEDIAEWLGKPEGNARYFKFSEEMRPVRLNKIVMGYPYNTEISTPFKFDIMLNYKLQTILLQHSNGKPTLIFCSTRKSVEMTSKHLTQQLTIGLNEQQKQKLCQAVAEVTDTRIRDFLIHGIGCHHAGMMPESRKAIENLFRNGDLPILVTTSTLAMGVNLPAHLVIIKSTKIYMKGAYQDYTETQLLQMIGRAGRPQFDRSATAVILTTTADKHKYEKMVCGNQPIESNLHRHLTEHLNAEVVLHTITDLRVAMEWLTTTFLHIRARKCPHQYNLTAGLTPDQVDKKLLEMCQIEINKLAKAGMLTLDKNTSISPTHTGSLMAKYYLAFETMKLFVQLNGTEILQQILQLISRCHEFSEMYLRVNDKKCLNLLNRCRDRETIRFPLNGKIKTLDMKINCLIQAVFGSLQILEPSLLNESNKVMRNGERISRGLAEFLETQEKCYQALLNSLILAKCFSSRLWENSLYVSKQLTGIGIAMSSFLVAAGKVSFHEILQSNPRDLERIINRKAPMGNTIIEQVQHIPQYRICLSKETGGEDESLWEVHLEIELTNAEVLRTHSTVDLNSMMSLLIGDSFNEVLLYEKYSHGYMVENPSVTKTLQVKRASNNHKVTAHFISDDWVGFDCESEIVMALAKASAEKRKLDETIQSTLNSYMKKTKTGKILATNTSPKVIAKKPPESQQKPKAKILEDVRISSGNNSKAAESGEKQENKEPAPSEGISTFIRCLSTMFTKFNSDKSIKSKSAEDENKPDAAKEPKAETNNNASFELTEEDVGNFVEAPEMTAETAASNEQKGKNPDFSIFKNDGGAGAQKHPSYEDVDDDFDLSDEIREFFDVGAFNKGFAKAADGGKSGEEKLEIEIVRKSAPRNPAAGLKNSSRELESLEPATSEGLNVALNATKAANDVPDFDESFDEYLETTMNNACDELEASAAKASSNSPPPDGYFDSLSPTQDKVFTNARQDASLKPLGNEKTPLEDAYFVSNSSAPQKSFPLANNPTKTVFKAFIENERLLEMEISSQKSARFVPNGSARSNYPSLTKLPLRENANFAPKSFPKTPRNTIKNYFAVSSKAGIENRRSLQNSQQTNYDCASIGSARNESFLYGNERRNPSPKPYRCAFDALPVNSVERQNYRKPTAMEFEDQIYSTPVKSVSDLGQFRVVSRKSISCISKPADDFFAKRTPTGDGMDGMLFYADGDRTSCDFSRKSIKWRSPLVCSPPNKKFSPHLKRGAKFSQSSSTASIPNFTRVADRDPGGFDELPLTDAQFSECTAIKIRSRPESGAPSQSGSNVADFVATPLYELFEQAPRNPAPPFPPSSFCPSTGTPQRRFCDDGAGKPPATPKFAPERKNDGYDMFAGRAPLGDGPFAWGENPPGPLFGQGFARDGRRSQSKPSFFDPSDRFRSGASLEGSRRDFPLVAADQSTSQENLHLFDACPSFDDGLSNSNCARTGCCSSYSARKQCCGPSFFCDEMPRPQKSCCSCSRCYHHCGGGATVQGCGANYFQGGCCDYRRRMPCHNNYPRETNDAGDKSFMIGRYLQSINDCGDENRSCYNTTQ